MSHEILSIKSYQGYMLHAKLEIIYVEYFI